MDFLLQCLQIHWLLHDYWVVGDVQGLPVYGHIESCSLRVTTKILEESQDLPPLLRRHGLICGRDLDRLQLLLLLCMLGWQRLLGVLAVLLTRISQ